MLPGRKMCFRLISVRAVYVEVDDMLRALDWIILAFLVFFIIMFAIGKGDVLLNLFSSGQSAEINKIYDRKKMDRASLILCIVLLITEILQAFIAPDNRTVAIVALVISVVAFVGYIAYLQKIRKDKK